MKSISLLVLLASATLWIPPLPAEEATAKPTVFSAGVLPFSETDETKSMGASTSELLGTELGKSGHLVLVERSQLDAILSEQGLGLTGTVDPQSAAKLGHLMGAQILVTGRVFKTGSKTYAIAKAISVSTGRSLPAQVEIAGDDLLGAATKLSTMLDEAITKHAADMSVAAESATARLERLKQTLGAKHLGKVFVKIPEHHLSRVIPDPAVQTEIEHTLQSLGATIATNETSADVIVTGEAISERAIQLGTLTSCRARCEITLVKQTDRTQKRVNRMTTGAVDIAENTAAKQALQSVGSKLAEWVVAEMVK
jgi:TolB-like protein